MKDALLKLTSRQTQHAAKMLRVLSENPRLTSVFGGDAKVVCRMDGEPYVSVTYSVPRLIDGVFCVYDDNVVFLEQSSSLKQFELDYKTAIEYLRALGENRINDAQTIVEEKGGYIGGNPVQVQEVYRVPSSEPDKSYLVVDFYKQGNGWVQCECKGFKYRKTCRHIQELDQSARKRYRVSYEFKGK